MTDSERLDQIWRTIGELSGQMVGVKAEMTALRNDLERMRQPHSEPISVHYWTVIISFIIAAAIIAALVFVAGVPR